MFQFVTSDRFTKALDKFDPTIDKKTRKCLRLLQINPRHNSLATHKVQNVRGAYGGDVFEAYVDIGFRLTWEYAGTDKHGNRLIYLRNIGKHDVCLSEP